MIPFIILFCQSTVFPLHSKIETPGPLILGMATFGSLVALWSGWNLRSPAYLIVEISAAINFALLFIKFGRLYTVNRSVLFYGCFTMGVYFLASSLALEVLSISEKAFYRNHVMFILLEVLANIMFYWQVVKMVRILKISLTTSQVLHLALILASMLCKGT